MRTLMILLLLAGMLTLSMYADDDYHKHQKYEEHDDDDDDDDDHEDDEYEKSSHRGDDTLVLPLYKMDLDLTKQQRRQIKKLLHDVRKQKRKLHDQSRSKGYEKSFLLDTFDADAFKKAKSREFSKKTDLEVQFLRALHSILNEKQRKRYAGEIENWELE